MTPYYQDDAVTIYHGDALEIAPGLSGVDTVATDPPYGMDWNFTGQGSGKGARGGRGSRYAGVTIVGDREAFDPSPWLAYPHVALWGFHHFPDRLARGSVLVWVKKYPDAYDTFLSDADLAWVKGGMGVYLSRPINPASFQHDRVHPTQKPVEIMEWTIQKAGGSAAVLDPYMGSGTTLVAAKALGRRAIGIEVDERYCEIAARRCSQEVLGLAV
jgi:site-specific DNA-methyltransferase (adenine-specific)